MKKYFSEILYILDNDRRKLPALLLLFLAVSALDLAGIGLIGPYISLLVDPQSISGMHGGLFEKLGLPTDQQSLLIIVGIVLLGVFLTKAISAIWINYKIVRFSQNQQVRLRTYLMQVYQSLPYTEYLARNSSEYIDSIHRLAGQFSQNVTLSLLKTISDGIVALSILALLAWTNSFALGLLIVLLGGVLYVYDRLFRRKMVHWGEQVNKAASEVVRGVNEGIEGFKELRILGRERYFYDKVKNGAEKYAYNQQFSQVLSIAPRYLLELMLIAFVVTVVVVTISLGKPIKELLPMLGMFGVASLRLLPTVNTASTTLMKLRYSRDVVARLFRDLKSIEKFENYSGNIKSFNTRKDETFRKLTIKDINFRYPNANRDALNNLSLDIHVGESIGLIGPSGSGKTTLVDVLLGLLTPQNGSIFYNDKFIKDCMGIWHSQVAYLPQQVFLIDNTLRSNIGLGMKDAEIDTERLNDAIKQARLSELVEDLPQGVETYIGERGVRLSGGQRQRVALARAFYHGRNVLVMDEATSSLDNETEREIVDEIKQLKGKKTMIVIAHRMSTVQHCDRIYRLEKGQIVESGSPDEVVKINKQYEAS